MIKIAKTLIAEQNAAEEEGKYENFTGTITYGLNKGKVEKAIFELKNNMIYWKDGIWKEGTWDLGNWEKGTWEGGTWIDGIWMKGTWEDGTWKNGKWYSGKDKDGNDHGKDDSPDNW